MSARSVVLAYHAIGPIPPDGVLPGMFTPPETFERQMDFLRRRRDVVSLETLLAGRPSKGRTRVAISFDDAYRSVLHHALPVLERHGFPAAVFAPTAWLGDRNRWDPQYDLDLDVMTEDELVEVSRRGFEVGSHGHRHIDLSAADEDEVRVEVRDSVDRLTALLGSPPRYLAYPYGRSSEIARRAVRDARVQEAFALEWEDRPFARSRTPVFSADRGWRFAFKSSGHYARLRRARVVQSGYSTVRPLLRRS